MKASEVITKAQRLLSDLTGVRWGSLELLDWLNEGQDESVRLLPEVNTVTEPVQLVPGTRQVIPTTAIRLTEVTRNMGLDGATPGRAVRLVERASLDAGNPDWHTDRADIEVLNYMFDKRNPKVFFVYPPQPAAASQVEVVYSLKPPTVATVDDDITIHEVYATSLVDYVTFRALSKDAEHAQGAALAGSYYKRFREGVTGKEMGDALVEPTT